MSDAKPAGDVSERCIHGYPTLNETCPKCATTVSTLLTKLETAGDMAEKRGYAAGMAAAVERLLPNTGHHYECNCCFCDVPCEHTDCTCGLTAALKEMKP